MRRFATNVTHGSFRWSGQGLVLAIVAGILTTAGGGRVLAQTERAKLTASDAAENDRFGRSVSISGDVAVIGAFRDDDACPGEPICDSGSAYVYRYDPPSGDWVEEAKLTASDATEGDFFGLSVSVSGDLAVIGTYSDDDAGGNSGSAYVFRYDPPSGKWIEEVKLTTSDAAENDRFGRSVSVSGDLAVIGAYGDSDTGSNSGSVYAYRYDPPSGEWIEEAKLTASDAGAGDLFGQSVAVSGDLAVIGAWRNSDAGDFSGSAYVYRYDQPLANWVEEAKLTASDAAENDRFGGDVSVSGDLAVIGALYDDDACPGDPECNSGSAYVYRYDAPSGEWIEEAKLTASDAAAGDKLGLSVSVSGDLAVIGAYGDDDAGIRSGSAYVYRYDPPTGEWIEKTKLTASDAAAGDQFGYTVSTGGDLAVIGARMDDDAGTWSGSAYVFDLRTPGDLDGDGDVDVDDYDLFVDCVTGPGGGEMPLECLSADADVDGDVDVLDFGAFQAVIAGP